MAELAMTILSTASQRLGSMLIEEAKSLYNVSDKIVKVQRDLNMLQCFLENAVKKQKDSLVIRNWVAEMRELAYEAEDIIEKYVIRVSHPREGGGGVRNNIKWFSRAIWDARPLHEVGSEIDALSLRMSDLSKMLQLCGVQSIARECSSHLLQRTRTLTELRRANSPATTEVGDMIVGLRKEAEALVHELVSTDKKVVVISGMGGIGKSTLAKKVSTHESVKRHFDSRIVWMFVSQEFQVDQFLRELLRKLWANDDVRKMSITELVDQELARNVRDTLQEKSYLIVLDDIWNEESWIRLIPALSLPQTSMSKLMLTTRSEKLKEVVDTQGYHHKQEPLSPEDSWSLLHKVVSRGERYPIDDEMKCFGENMLKRCNYLPLATVAIGGMLKSRKTLDEWRVIHDNIQSITTIKTEQGFTILQVIELSYNDLPYFLRPCFLHLASFPEDHRIPVNKLYRLWEAEGFVSVVPQDYVDGIHQKLETVDDVAHLYMDELVKRCIVLEDERNSNTGKMKTCRLHDFVRDMCVRKAKEENFLSIMPTVLENSANLASTSTSVPTRLNRLVFDSPNPLHIIITTTTSVPY